MLDTIAITDIACRASNLSERIALVKKISIGSVSKRYTNSITSLDNWMIDKLTSKLAVMQIQQQIFQPLSSSVPTEPEIQQLLTDYKLCERNLVHLPETIQQLFIDIHLSWLSIYKDALETINLPKSDFIDAVWFEPNVYYGRFAKVCEPFLRFLQKRLQVICNQVTKNRDSFNIHYGLITDIQFELINRFEMKLARAIEADINVYCYKNKIYKSSPKHKEEYITYLESSFTNESSYHSFYCKFPVLARWLAEITGFLIKNSEELLQRVVHDLDEISSVFFEGIEIQQVTSLKLGKSDFHTNGCSVVFVEMALSDVNQVRENKILVYKPRCIQSEAAMQGLLKTLTEAEVSNFSTYQLLCKEGYGYVEYIPFGKNQVESEEHIKQFYNQLGGYLAIFYILGGSDMHFENILAANSNAFICDCETVLEAIPEGMEQGITLFDSVFKAGMLDWPQEELANINERVSLTGYSGGESYKVPFAVPTITNRLSLALAVEQQVGVLVDVAATNRLFHDGQLVKPQKYKHSIVDGFNCVYLWFQKNKEQVINIINNLFATSSIRFVNRATQVYAHLINASQHAKCLSDPLEVDLIFYSLVKYPRSWDERGQLAKFEFASLWQLDIPIFTASANSRYLLYNYQLPLPNLLAISPLENAAKRIQQLSNDNQTRQNQYIYASLSTNDADSEYFTSSALDYAYQIGTQLCSLLQDPSCTAPWKTIEFTPTGKKIADVDTSLYGGSAGICLFLAYLNSIRPEEKFQSAAERALAHAVIQRNDIMIGAFQGSAGLIYLLTHLAHLWHKPELLEQACQLATELTPLIDHDHYYDVIHGVAGIIPVLLGLAKFTSGRGLEQARLCAQHLLQNAVLQNETLSWPFNPELAKANLTGFSHGTAGIGWALISLGCQIDEGDYIIAGRKAFAYEATQFDPKERNWYDLRTSVMTKDAPGPKFAYYWCSGSTGIGLSRIASWYALGKTDEVLYQEAHTAVNATLRSLHNLDNDSLCHGRAGSTELLLRYAKLAEQPYLRMEAKIQATEQWKNYERTRCWNCGAGSDVVPGLLMGLAGIGMHFLRLAYPHQIPSPLMLDAPLI
ncbi:type 2 lanthipeptide synthetase LanM family protein [Planktothrix sp. FACHB-1365]|uniref:type 2 lanthipeptide synthetase LanM family protein n=1 Tax=Planktothrix sp. FACHB-1365 TaxID=2692855 RepID=UPI0016897261|nr:type 2 lanthipeptide synthetase LanM family protein [Planktothrix sp. FACHB-1365]MBD2484028.1 type 2 lantipeptide synthetase LanM [Planktothrix sp. FACHB-1365]